MPPTKVTPIRNNPRTLARTQPKRQTEDPGGLLRFATVLEPLVCEMRRFGIASLGLDDIHIDLDLSYDDSGKLLSAEVRAPREDA